MTLPSWIKALEDLVSNGVKVFGEFVILGPLVSIVLMIVKEAQKINDSIPLQNFRKACEDILVYLSTK